MRDESPGKPVVGEHIAEDPRAVERRREQVRHDEMQIEPPRVAEEVVVGELPLGLDEIDGVEARAQLHRVQPRFAHVDVDELRAVAARRQHDRRAPVEIRVVQRLLALDDVFALVDVPRLERDHLLRDLGRERRVAVHRHRFHRRHPARIDRIVTSAVRAAVVHDDRVRDLRVGVALVPERIAQPHVRRVEIDEVERLSLVHQHRVLHRAFAQHAFGLLHRERLHDDGLSLGHLEGHANEIRVLCARVTVVSTSVSR